MSDATSQDCGGKSHRYQMLDIWRGLVCLLVVVEHVGVALWPEKMDGSGWEGWLRLRLVDALTWNIGTPMFFVISGYCIAASLHSAARKGTGPVQFLARRAWRIFPTYWAALLLFVGVVMLLDSLGRVDLYRSALALELESPGRLSLSQWLGNITLTETWRPRVWGDASSVYTRVAWSLCFQEQFYAVCCLVLWLSPRRLFRGLAWASGLILFFNMTAWDIGFSRHIEGTFPLRWHEFAVGILAYWRLTVGPDRSVLSRRVAEAALVVLLAIGLSYRLTAMTAASTFGLLLVAVHRWDAAAAGLACLGPLRACGKRSFSIYLTHLPVSIVGNNVLFQLGLADYWVRALVLVPLVVAASIAVGWGFYALVESRFLGAPALPGLPRRTKAAEPILIARPA